MSTITIIAPKTKTIQAPPPKAVEEPKAVESNAEARSFRFGSPDGKCHTFLGTVPFRYTVCFKRTTEPVAEEDTHLEPPCPNGNPPCPECDRIRKQRYDR